MSYSLEKLTLSKEVIHALHLLELSQISCVLVGGTVRDYLISGGVSKDLDFEFRSNLCAKSLKSIFYKVFQTEVEECSFNVYKVLFKGHELEFSQARIETFSEKLGESGYGHSDFIVDFPNSLSFEDSFRRRDFSINAIGVSFKESGLVDVVIDPFNGIKDLSEKQLKICSDNFFLDPVRFLRLIRFSISHNFIISKQIHLKMKLFNLLKMSSFYFFKESFKKDFSSFINIFFKLVGDYKIKLPGNFNSLLGFKGQKVSEFEINDSSSLYWWAIVTLQLDSNKIEEIRKVLPIKNIIIKKLQKLSELRKLNLDYTNFSLLDLEIDKIFESEELRFYLELNELNKLLDINLDGHYPDQFVGYYCEIRNGGKYEFDQSILKYATNKNEKSILKYFSLLKFKHL